MKIRGTDMTTLQPIAALVIYKGTYNYEYSDKDTYYSTVHRVVDGNLGVGQPLTIEGVKHIHSLIAPPKYPQFISENLLAIGDDVKVWWVKAGKRFVHFSKSTAIKSGWAELPALIFKLHKGSLFVWALKDNKKPTPETLLYHSPFFNCLNGHVCTGNAALPKDDEIKDWEDVFFGSSFTKEASPMLKGIKGETLWEKLIKNKGKFPTKHLVQEGTLNELLQRRY